MRIVFLESDPMWIHGLPNGFRDTGHDILISGPITEENLQHIALTFQPELIITMGWGPENSSLKKQRLIREFAKSSQVPHIYWATEDPTHTQSFTIPFLKTVQPDFVFTICHKNVEYYKSLGIYAAHLDFGFHPTVHYRTESMEIYKGNIAVVANAYPNRLDMYPKHYRRESLRILIKPLLKAGIRVDFYGRHWDKMYTLLGVEIPKEWIHGYLPYIEANKVYSSNDIVIGLQNSLTQVTQRTYEILGSGGFLLTNNTPEINRLFKANRDLVVSSSPIETLELVKYYLNNPEKRKIIQTQGQADANDHTYCQRAKYIMNTLNEQGIFSGKKSEYNLDLMQATSFISGDWEFYTARNGDTLWKISRIFNTTIKQIMELNELDSDKLEAGQLLKIRKSKDANLVKVIDKINCYTAPSENNNINYTVKKGDTLLAISEKLGLSVDEIIKLNRLSSDIIYIGQVLKIKL